MKNIIVVTSGRQDLVDFFEKDNGDGDSVHSGNPYIVFVVSNKTKEVTVKIIDSEKDLLTYSDDTKVMKQWEGQWRSDFFQFTVGQFRDAILKKNRKAEEYIKLAKEIEVTIGSMGKIKHVRVTHDPYISDYFSNNILWDIIYKLEPQTAKINQEDRNFGPRIYTFAEWKPLYGWKHKC